MQTRELSPRQRQVADLLQKGWTDAMIAEELGIAASTVAHHVKTMYAKADVPNRTAFAVWWTRHPSEEGIGEPGVDPVRS